MIGIDLTLELVRRARTGLRQGSKERLRFEQATAEALPRADGSADALLANGVGNLFVPDKARALEEAYRVLRPGGRLVLADAFVPAAQSRAERSEVAGWVNGLAGALPAPELLELARSVGFVELELRETRAPVARGRERPARAGLLLARRSG